MRHSLLVYFVFFFYINNVLAEHKVVARIFNFLESIEDRSSFEQNKSLLKLIWYNRNILLKELTQNDNPSPQISEFFLKLAAFTNENFDKIATKDREFDFPKDQLKRLWQFIIKKIKLLLKANQLISLGFLPKSKT